MSSKTGNCYLLLGPDRASKLERVRQLAQQLRLDPLDMHRLSAAETSTPDLLSLIRQHPMKSALRLIVIDDAHRLDGASLETLAQQRGVVQQAACVVLMVESDLEDTPAWQAMRAYAVVEEFSGSASSAPDHFAWLNAIARRDIPSALQGLREQRASGKEELELLGLIVWQVQRWLTLAHLLKAGTPRQEIETITGWKPWQIQRLSEELQGRTVVSLQRALEACWRLDVQAKRGRLPALTTALEQVVVGLCLPAPATTSRFASSSGRSPATPSCDESVPSRRLGRTAA